MDYCNKFFDQQKTCFTLTTQILARSLADRHRNLLFVRCVNQREWTTLQFVIVKKAN